MPPPPVEPCGGWVVRWPPLRFSEPLRQGGRETRDPQNLSSFMTGPEAVLSIQECSRASPLQIRSWAAGPGLKPPGCRCRRWTAGFEEEVQRGESIRFE